MPSWGEKVPDATTSSRDLLLAHVRLGHEARRTFPWCDGLDDDTFRRYVLAYRMTTERLEDWRTYLWNRAELRSLVDGYAARCRSETDTGARDRVFREMIRALGSDWVGSHVPYAARGMPDLSPLEAIAQASGRSADQANTFVAILRTFGVAATCVRVVAGPDAAGSSIWAAVWDPVTRDWLDVEPGQSGSADDPSYFRRFVRDREHPIAKVWWVTPGEDEAGDAAPRPLLDGEAYPPTIEKYFVAEPMIDRTERYAEVTDLVRDHVPPSSTIWLAVWNSGAWRPVAGARSSSDGRVVFRKTGCGVRYRLMTWTKAAAAYCSDVIVCRMDGTVETTAADAADDAALLQMAALGLLESGDVRGAKERLLQAVTLSPGRPSSLYDLACACARLGEKPEALDWLERAVDAGWTNFDLMKGDPDLASVRNEPQFIRLLDERR